MKFSRAFSMPSGDTFSMAPVRAFVGKYLAESRVSVDPFARNSGLATFTNDLDPCTSAQSHEDAATFLGRLADEGVRADLIFFDPPYSPRQISELYRHIGKTVGSAETQNGALYRRVRDAAARLTAPGAVVLSFGWNSTGMGAARGFEIEEMLLVHHGGAHNDTICLAERRLAA
jgi:hypothetical protein